MRALKITVVVLGILIVIAFAALIYGIVQGWGSLDASARAPAAIRAPIAGTSAAWGRIGLGLPEGTRIESVTAAGNLIVLHLRGASGGEERLVVVDPTTGAVIGSFLPNEAR